MNNKAISTIKIFVFVFLSFFIVLFLGVGVFTFGLVNDALNQSVIVSVNGNLTLADVNDDSFGKMNEAFIAQADNIGIGIVFSMVIFMFLTAFYIEPNLPKVALVLDFFILIFEFILAVYIAIIYSIMIEVDPFTTIFINTIPISSRLILNLPWIITIIWGILIFINYSGIKKQSKESLGGVVGFG